MRPPKYLDHALANIPDPNEARLTQQVVEDTKARIEAGFAYVTSAEKIPIEDLNKDPRFVHVHPDVLKAWAKADRWISRRREFFKGISKNAEKAIASDLVQSQVDEYRRMIQLRDTLEDTLQNAPPKPKSLEGLAKARIDVGKRLTELSSAVVAEILPKDVDAGDEALVGVELDDEEKEFLVKQLLERRRAKALIAPEITDDEDDYGLFDGEERGEEAAGLPGGGDPSRSEGGPGGHGLDGSDDPDS